MNTFKRFLLTGTMVLSASLFSTAQIMTVSTAHWSMDTTGSFDEWLELETDFHEKLVMPNDKIKGAQALYHYYTSDNSEILFINIYDSWEDIPLADEKMDELAEKEWKKKEDRKELSKKRNKYYTSMHSDEIYTILPNSKPLANKPDSSLIVYIQKFRASWPDDGSADEIKALSKEFHENITHKNEAILGYYPLRHMYGADSRDLINVYYLETLADLDRMNEINDKLIEAYWPDEDKRKAYFKSIRRYRERWHGDALYSLEQKLYK